MSISFGPKPRLLGEGGFGTVFEKAPGAVLKAFKQSSVCGSISTEFETHNRVYAAFQAAVAADPSLQWRIVVPKPVQFCSNADHCSSLQDAGLNPGEYACSYEMERVTTSRADGLSEHIILADWAQDFTPAIRCVRGDSLSVDVRFTRSSFKTCGPRGSFLGRSVFGAPECERFASSMGTLVKICLSAQLVPIDAEYVRDAQGRVALLDFGLFEPLTTYELGIERLQSSYDMYLPFDDDALAPVLLRAMRSGKSLTKI